MLSNIKTNISFCPNISLKVGFLFASLYVHHIYHIVVNLRKHFACSTCIMKSTLVFAVGYICWLVSIITMQPPAPMQFRIHCASLMVYYVLCCCVGFVHFLDWPLFSASNDDDGKWLAVITQHIMRSCSWRILFKRATNTEVHIWEMYHSSRFVSTFEDSRQQACQIHLSL